MARLSRRENVLPHVLHLSSSLILAVVVLTLVLDLELGDDGDVDLEIKEGRRLRLRILPPAQRLANEELCGQVVFVCGIGDGVDTDMAAAVFVVVFTAGVTDDVTIAVYSAGEM